MYDDKYASPESSLAQEQYNHRQPKLRDRAHGARHKHISHLELGENCNRTRQEEIISSMWQVTQYYGRRPSHFLPRRSSYIPNGAK